jgi:hypothetical protein
MAKPRVASKYTEVNVIYLQIWIMMKLVAQQVEVAHVVPVNYSSIELNFFCKITRNSVILDR